MRIRIDKRTIQIVNAYLPADENIPVSNFLQLFASKKAILLGDFNAAHPLWGSRIPNERGGDLPEAIDEANMAALNDYHTTHVALNSTSNILDFSMDTADITTRLVVDVLSDLSGSDHFLSLKTFQHGKILIASVHLIYNFIRADWELCTHLVDQGFNNNDPREAGVNEFCNNIIHCVSVAANEGIPVIKRKSCIRRMTRVCCEDVKNAINARNRAQHVWQRSRLLNDWMAYKREKAAAQRTITHKIRESWENYCSNVTEEMKAGTVSRVIHSMEKEAAGRRAVNVLVDGSALTNDKDKADLFAKHFARVSSSSN